MTCSCEIDERPDFYCSKFVVARKEHECCECGYIIKRKETHLVTTGMWGGYINRYRTCERCSDLWDSLSEVTCIQHGGLQEDYSNYLEEFADGGYSKAADVMISHRRYSTDTNRVV